MSDDPDPDVNGLSVRYPLVVACVGTTLLAAGFLAATRLAPSLAVALWNSALAGLASGAAILVSLRPEDW